MTDTLMVIAWVAAGWLAVMLIAAAVALRRIRCDRKENR